MNGRLYDPVIGRFFSPDNYVANSTFTQDFNRYIYARNNPLHYTDPSGESLLGLFVGAFITGMVNMMLNANNIQHNWQAFAYFGLGFVAGLIGITTGYAVSGFIGAGTSIGFANGFAAGFTSGFMGGITSGFITGAGNTWVQGGTFGQGIGAGLGSGFKAGSLSGLTAGITGGMRGVRTKGVLFSIAEEFGIDPMEAIPDEYKNSGFLSKVQRYLFPGSPKTEHIVDAKYDKPGWSIPDVDGRNVLIGTGKIYYHPIKAFTSMGQLYHTMGHELVHISQFAALSNKITSDMLKVPAFRGMLEHYAENYVLTLRGIEPINLGKDFSHVYYFYNQLNYESFSWSKNHLYWTWRYLFSY